MEKHMHDLLNLIMMRFTNQDITSELIRYVIFLASTHEHQSKGARVKKLKKKRFNFQIWHN